MIYRTYENGKVSYLAAEVRDSGALCRAEKCGITLVSVPYDDVSAFGKFSSGAELMLSLPGGCHPADALRRALSALGAERAGYCVIESVDGYVEDDYAAVASLVADGTISRLGFLADGETDDMKRITDFFGGLLTFCAMTLNWANWESAAPRVKYLMDREYPILALDPLAGGTLAALPAEDEATLRAMRPDESVTAWAFRFLQSIPCIVSILCPAADGYADIMGEHKPLTPAERAALFRIAGRL